jgi:hypothetical protein
MFGFSGIVSSGSKGHSFAGLRKTTLFARWMAEGRQNFLWFFSTRSRFYQRTKTDHIREHSILLQTRWCFVSLSFTTCGGSVKIASFFFTFFVPP